MGLSPNTYYLKLQIFANKIRYASALLVNVKLSNTIIYTFKQITAVFPYFAYRPLARIPILTRSLGKVYAFRI